ncbi:MAG: hypothetical protein WBD27_02045 [Pyrinomonadaceae bacterium]
MSVIRLWVISLWIIVGFVSVTNAQSSSIRSVDFGSFTYTWPLDYAVGTRSARKFTLNGGELEMTKHQMGVSLSNVIYGDVTGDDVEEAIVALSIRTGGSAIPGIVYVFAFRSGRPSQLWSFSTGDRADGGLRETYSEDGNLVVEVFGPKRRDEADGQPKRFTRSRYVWRNQRFQPQTGNEIIELAAL